MARLSGAPGAAMIFGPIFGGLIAKIALHYPILVKLLFWFESTSIVLIQTVLF